MPTDVIASVEQVTREWLTDALLASGALGAGTVIGVDVETSHGNWSRNAKLRPLYSTNARGARPGSLFLKMVSTDLGDCDTSATPKSATTPATTSTSLPPHWSDATMRRIPKHNIATICCSTTSAPPTVRRPDVHPTCSMRSRSPMGSPPCTPAGGAPTG
jgi:hypothetical protein